MSEQFQVQYKTDRSDWFRVDEFPDEATAWGSAIMSEPWNGAAKLEAIRVVKIHAQPAEPASAEPVVCPMCAYEGEPCPGGAHGNALYEDGIRTVEDYAKMIALKIAHRARFQA